jgi:CheY-like chemotaxis protein
VNKLLLVDADPRRVCVLDVSLRQSGYDVAIAGDGADALEKMEWDAPDLVVADTHLPVLDGFVLLQTLRKHPELAAVPVVFLASEPSEADEKHAIDLGADAYLPRPVHVRDLAARIRLLLVNRARESANAELFSVPLRHGRLNGSTRDMALVDLLQDICGARATGVVRLRSGPEEAHIFFRGGSVVDAQVGHLRGEQAICRALLWDDASFDVKFKPVLNEDVIHCTTQTLVMRAMNRVDDWLRLCACAKPLAAVLDMTPNGLLARLSALGEFPDPLKAMALPPPRDSHPELLRAAPIGPRGAASPLRASEGAHQIVGPDLRKTMIMGSGPDPRTAMRIVATGGDMMPPAPAAEVVEATAAQELPSAASSASGTREAHPEHPVGSDLPTTTITASSSDLRAGLVHPPDPLTQAADVESGEPTAAPELRSSPSSPPWTREPHEGAEAVYDAELHAAGVPHALGTATKRIGAAVMGVAAVVGITVSLHSVRNRQMREAEQARGASAVAVRAGPSVFGSSPEPAALPAGKGAPGEASVVAKALAEASGGVAGVPDVLPPAPPTTPKDLGAAVSPAAIASHAAVRERPLDTGLAVVSRSPLVRDAQRLLLKGDAAHATEVAQTAVSSDPSDADAWLTLAAARLTVGDSAGAAEAYGACVAQARTVGVTHCRVFAQRLPPHD